MEHMREQVRGRGGAMVSGCHAMKGCGPGTGATSPSLQEGKGFKLEPTRIRYTS